MSCNACARVARWKPTYYLSIIVIIANSFLLFESILFVWNNSVTGLVWCIPMLPSASSLPFTWKVLICWQWVVWRVTAVAVANATTSQDSPPRGFNRLFELSAWGKWLDLGHASSSDTLLAANILPICCVAIRCVSMMVGVMGFEDKTSGRGMSWNTSCLDKSMRR